MGDKKIQNISGVDQILPLSEFHAYLAKNLKTTTQVYAIMEDIKAYGGNDTLKILNDLRTPINEFNNEIDVLR